MGTKEVNSPKQYMSYVLYLSQELRLDAATPGKVASDRLLANAKLLGETIESWANYCGWRPKDLMEEVINGNEAIRKQLAERTKKATGRRTRN
jgi:hypothetical protein